MGQGRYILSKINQQSGYESIPPLAKNFPVKVRKYTNSGKLVPHWHEHLELIYFTGGKCTAYVAGRAIDVGEGDLLVVNGTEVHSLMTRGESIEYLCVLIYPEFFRDIDGAGPTINNLVRGDAHAAECIKDMYNEYERGGAAADMMQKSLAYRLMSHLVRHHSTDPISDRSLELHRAALTRLDAVLDMVAERYREKLSTRDLAEACYLSEAHFCRFFKSATGKTALEYLNDYRSERADVLLANTAMSLSEVAESVGFDDVNYFCRVYKRAMGVIPSKRRKGALLTLRMAERD